MCITVKTTEPVAMALLARALQRIVCTAALHSGKQNRIERPESFRPWGYEVPPQCAATLIHILRDERTFGWSEGWM